MYTLDQIFETVEKSVAALKFPEEPANLYTPLSYMLSMGGKRLRPTLCAAGWLLYRDELTDEVLQPAMALEVFHSFTLIHDDIMDKADIRRGLPTVYKKWNSDIAILSGDVMSIKAYELLSKAPAERLPQALALFTKTAAEVCEGQQYDMDFENCPHTTLAEYLKMIGLKTAVLLACSVKLGALLAGAPEKAADAIYEYGYKLGMAFQIQDDYLDTFGDSSTFGKSIGGDITNNKKTWLLIESLSRLRKKGNEQDLKEMEMLLGLGERFAQEKIQGVRALYERSGARQEAERAVEKYYKEALKALKELDVPSDRLQILHNLAEKILKRNK